MGDVVDAKIADATPAVKAILEKVDEAIQAMIEKAQAHIETGKAILVDLLDTIIAKIAELKDSIAGYSILDDLLNDVLKPALKNAIENLIPTISKHLGDLADKLVGKTEYISITDIMQAAQALKDIFDMVKAKIESGEIQDHMVEFLQKLSAFIEAKIVAARPVVAAILQKVDEAVKILMEKAKNGIESGKAIMDELVRTILDKIAELKDSIGGYKVEYISIIDLIDAAQVLKDIFARVKAKIESGEIKDNIVDFLQKIKAIVDAKIAAATPAVQAILEKIDEAIAILIEKAKGHVATGKAILESGEIKDNIVDFLQKIKDIVDAKIAAATPAVKAILEKVDEAIQILIEKAKGHVETGRAILVDLLETIIAKISELKDNIAGYSIFDDLLTDVLKPALKHAIEGLIPVISKHLGDLADKLVGKTEYLSITDIFQAVQALKDVFDQIKAKIESGEIHDNLNDFLEKIKDVVEAKMATANEHVKAILEKVDEAVKIIIERVNAHLENGRNVLVDLLETIIAKIGELKDNLAGYNIMDDLLNDVLKPALKHAIDGLIPVISKHLGNLADKLVG